MLHGLDALHGLGVLHRLDVQANSKDKDCLGAGCGDHIVDGEERVGPGEGNIWRKVKMHHTQKRSLERLFRC